MSPHPKAVSTAGLSPGEVRELILATRGEEFVVVFRKRTDGSQRTMRAQTRPRTGGPPSYDFASKGLLPVWDLDRNDWRSIPLDGVMSFTPLGDGGVEALLRRPEQ